MGKLGDGAMKMCSDCKVLKPESEFYRSRITNDGLRYECKVCNSPSKSVSNAPLRDEFTRLRRLGVVTATGVGRELGWCSSRGRSDSGRVLAALGLRKYSPGHGYPPRLRERVNRKLALELAHAMNLDPVEVGL